MPSLDGNRKVSSNPPEMQKAWNKPKCAYLLFSIAKRHPGKEPVWKKIHSQTSKKYQIDQLMLPASNADFLHTSLLPNFSVQEQES